MSDLPPPPAPGAGDAAGGGAEPTQVAALRFSIQLPAAPISVSVARAALTAVAQSIIPDRVHAAELVLSELVTNAIRHGSPHPDDTIEVDIDLDLDQLSAQVRDRGPAFNLRAHPPTGDQVGGFGLYIAAMTSHLTVRHDGHGNVVTFTMPRALTGVPSGPGPRPATSGHPIQHPPRGPGGGQRKRLSASE